jgi:pyruvate formate lyase activating enzyme
MASVDDLVEAVEPRTECVCFFGGDPTPQTLFALAALERVAEHKSVRICWESNGAMGAATLERMIDASLRTGGTIKFDLKAWHPGLHRVLTGAPRRWVWRNLTRLIERSAARPDPPLAVAGTCLVPGYVDVEEVRSIATALAALDPDLPYSLLAFHPAYLMGDFPTTSREHAEACEAAARGAGLTRVRIANQHLLR